MHSAWVANSLCNFLLFDREIKGILKLLHRSLSIIDGSHNLSRVAGDGEERRRVSILGIT